MATLIRADDHVEVPDRLPVVALRDLVFFPYIVLPILIGRQRSVAALASAQEGAGLVLLVAQRDPSVDDPTAADLFRVGTVARIVQVTTLPDGTSRVVLEGLGRARIRRLTTTTEALRASVELLVAREAESAAGSGVPSSAESVTSVAIPPLEADGAEAGDVLAAPGDTPAVPEADETEDQDEAGPDAVADDGSPTRLFGADPDGAAEIASRVARGRSLDSVCDNVRRLYAEYARLHERIPEELSGMLSADGDRVRFAHLVAGHLIIPALEKQEVLEATDLNAQLDILREMLVRELEILRIERKLDRQIQLQLGGKGSPFDLGLRPPGREEAPDEPEEWEEIARQIREGELPPHAKTRAEKELARLRKLNPVAPEAAVIRTHLDWITSLPWAGRSKDNLDVGHATEILEAEHFGLGEVKERVLDHVAVLSLVGEMRGPILCLVGPPGVGKTSLGRSIANALGREFVRVSLGGVRDEAEIRGHRRTYVGALPGRVIQGMRRSGTRNPVFLLDEIDKLARDFHGDPGAALLEVLDPEQNRSFTDHYLELEYDLSDVLFVATANTLQGVPEPLRDRMEVIRLPGYLDTEKREIAHRFLWPRQAAQHGLPTGMVTLSTEAMHEIIERYTREAGVRELNRRLSRVARKLARNVADGEVVGPTIQASELKELLGPITYQPPERDEDSDRIGIANGLAWTNAGGQVMDVEVAIVEGGGNLRLTGTLGDVMKESAQAAVTYARSRAQLLGLDPHFHEKIDVHIHIPEGATPKDGPSAGITIAAALISALTDTPTRADVAMTGEVTLRGRVIAVGGIKEKAVAALRNGMARVILPKANENDLETLPEEVLEAVHFDLVKTMDQVMDAVLVHRPESARTSKDSDLGVALPHG